MSDWWRSIEEELDARSVDAPDPWGDLEPTTPVELTDEQQRFLLALADQPAVPRIDALDDVLATHDSDDAATFPDVAEEWDG
jgi:hypothetical protein